MNTVVLTAQYNENTVVLIAQHNENCGSDSSASSRRAAGLLYASSPLPEGLVFSLLFLLHERLYGRGAFLPPV
jgi:hypothetical protein